MAAPAETSKPEPPPAWLCATVEEARKAIRNEAHRDYLPSIRTNDVGCPKCDAAFGYGYAVRAISFVATSMDWLPNLKTQRYWHHYQFEHLKMRCSRCSYEWKTRTADIDLRA